MNTKVNFHPQRRKGAAKSTTRTHRLPRCAITGAPRYRDRHQARAGARAAASGSNRYEVSTFACPDCRGWHVETNAVVEPIVIDDQAAPAEHFIATLATRRRRYFLVDIENPTRGAKASGGEVAAFWRLLRTQAPGIAPRDHVVVGASRSVARKYRPSVHGPNVKWIIGANAPDAADNALLAAIDLRRVARSYDELVIVSGDHAFADLARRAKASGLTVHVVTAEHPENRSMLSRDLSAAADIRTVVRLRARSQQARTIQATRAMSAAWRQSNQHTLAA